jgi:hypothetical protein
VWHALPRILQTAWTFDCVVSLCLASSRKWKRVRQLASKKNSRLCMFQTAAYRILWRGDLLAGVSVAYQFSACHFYLTNCCVSTN